jgi:hypothetical protein
MPVVLGHTSFSMRSVAADRLTVTAGAAVYDTADRPSDSGSRTSLGGAGLAFRRPWFDDVNATTFEPSGAQVLFGVRLKTTVNDASNATLRAGVARNGTEYITLSAQDGTNKVTLRVAGVVRATATVALTLSAWERLMVRVTGDEAGDVVHVYRAGNLSTPILSYVLVAADETALAAVGKPNEFVGACKTGAAGDRFDDFAAWDPAASGFPGLAYFAFWFITDQSPSGDGAEQDMTGSAEDIDELPPDAADGLVASTVGEESQFTHAAIGNAANVFAVKLLAAVQCDGTGAGTQLELRDRDATHTQAVTVPAPADGFVEHTFETAPDGLPWTPAKYDATRFGFVSAS